MNIILQRIINHFIWTNWQSIGEQFDEYQNKRFEVFRKTNKNGLNKYKKVLIVGSAYYPNNAQVLTK